MNNRKNRWLRRVLAGLAVAAAVCVVGYYAFVYWVNASGSLLERNVEQAGRVDQGSAIVVEGEGRRAGVFTLFIAATDEDETRTDSMMVLVFDTNSQTANVINIPRDTLVDTERRGAGKKLNASHAAGIEEQLDEVAGVIGFRPDKYIVANFDGIADIVDAIGGIDYEIPFDMSYHDASQDLAIEFEQGWQHLDGEQVVEFLRWRHNDDGTGYDDGDIGRVEKLQTFLVALGKEVLSPSNLFNIPAIAAAVSDNVDTDLTTSQVLWLGMQGMKLDMDEDVHMQTLIGDNAMVGSLWFFILDEEMVIDQINESFNPYLRRLTEDDFNIITPDDLGIYSSSWRTERAIRYASYEAEEDGETGSGQPPEDEDR
ncbi:MAG TPA: LCP family protein [Candidatus Butyricicoccus stercorigallinarum]|nr:LCP family protein [Candidatus Butyricicoccus stercorigallinarum]